MIITTLSDGSIISTCDRLITHLLQMTTAQVHVTQLIGIQTEIKFAITAVILHSCKMLLLNNLLKEAEKMNFGNFLVSKPPGLCSSRNNKLLYQMIIFSQTWVEYNV